MSELPECVRRLRAKRGMRPASIWDDPEPPDGVEQACLEWLATGPEPEVHAAMGMPHQSCRHCNTPLPEETAIIAAASGDVEAFRREKEDRDGDWSAVARALERATIIDRAALVAWLQDIAHEHPSHGCDCYGCRMPPELRALLKDADG